MSRFSRKNESRLNVSNLFNENEDGAPVVSGISTFSSPHYFVPPSGSTAQRPSNPGEGMIRFNTDSGHLEYYTGTHWADVITNNNELGGEDLSATANENENRVSTTSAYAAYGTVAENVTTNDLPVTATHYSGLIRDLQSGGFKISLTGNSSSHDFFMGCWIKFDTYSTDRQMGIDLFGDYVYFETQASGAIAVRHNGGSRADSSATDLDDGNWHHIALSREGGTLRGFLNGTAVISTTSGVSGNSVQSNENFWFFGGSGTSYNTDAKILDIFVYGGTGVTSYTTPTAPLIGSDGSINHFSGFSDSDALYISPGVAVPVKSPTSNQGTGHRALFSRGYVAPANVNNIDYLTISTQGNTQDFGDTVLTKRQGVAFSSSTRSLTAGAENRNVTIDFVTIASTGDAQDFGDLAKGRSEGPGAASNQTRAIIAGGNEATPGRTNAMEAITMATLGDGVDFGDLTVARQQFVAKANSSVRAVFASGSTPGNSNIIDYMTISTLGNAQDYGDLTVVRRTNMYAESATRGIFAGGYTPDATNVMDFITIQTLGNAQDFGDLPTARNLGNGGTSNCVRGVFAHFASPQAGIDFCQIATTGNAQSFGDLGSGARQQAGASSNGHGGL